MQDLKVIGAEQGALIMAAEDGQRYRVVIDEAVQSKLRRSIPVPDSAHKPTPRDIQTQIRSGRSAEEVAAATGTPLEYIQRFEGPVLAEREHIVQSALAVPVHTAMDADPSSPGVTFGTAIQERLYGLGVAHEHWTSWKEAGGGWVVKLVFTADGIEHDARWSFDPRKAGLAPLNGEAVTLSQQGDASGTLVPRLRAVGGEQRVADSSRFDSGAFSQEELGRVDTAPQPQAQQQVDPFPHREQVDHDDVRREGTSHVGQPTPGQAPSSQTADLLDALRRRRGEREAAATGDDETSTFHPSVGMHLVDMPLADFDDDSDDALFPTLQQPATVRSRTGRKGRVTMPSWDEIVFGAKPGDDPA